MERRVWEFISYLMKDPEELNKDLEKMIELEKRGAHGDPERESKAWLDKLTEVDAERRGYLKLAARGSMTEAELDVALAELEEARATAERELAALQNRQEAIAELERDRAALLEHYAAIAPEALDSLAPEERYQLYKMLRLEVVVRLDANLEVRGAFGEGLLVSNLELVPGLREALRPNGKLGPCLPYCCSCCSCWGKKMSLTVMFTSVTLRPTRFSTRLMTFLRTASATWWIALPYSTLILRSTAASTSPTSTETPRLSLWLPKIGRASCR